MVTILPARRTFGAEFGRGLGGGFSKGVAEELKGQQEQKKMQKAEELKGQRKKEEMALLKSLRSQEESPQQFLEDENAPWYMKEFQEPDQAKPKGLLQPKEQRLSPEEHAALTIPDEAIEAAAIINPAVAREWRAAKDSALKQKQQEEKSRTAKEAQYFKFNEPKLAEVAAAERKTTLENARFQRLGELFKEKEKFPSPLLASIMSKEGTINDVAYSQLSPEAQEAVKLIIDSTSGIKDTYGSRVTNFDLQTYLKKLPSLLMSPEGRERVLRDLASINEINQIYNSGIQQIFEEAGGSDKISFSQAESKFKKRYGPLINDKIKEFVMPAKKSFKQMPSPTKFLGKKIRNTETGEIMISDGIEWKPAE